MFGLPDRQAAEEAAVCSLAALASGRDGLLDRRHADVPLAGGRWTTKAKFWTLWSSAGGT